MAVVVVRGGGRGEEMLLLLRRWLPMGGGFGIIVHACVRALSPCLHVDLYFRPFFVVYSVGVIEGDG